MNPGEFLNDFLAQPLTGNINHNIVGVRENVEEGENRKTKIYIQSNLYIVNTVYDEHSI